MIDKFLDAATEVDVDCLADYDSAGSNDATARAIVIGVMEHIEEAGIHSGDSSCSLPPYTLSEGLIEEIAAKTRLLAQRLKVVGLMNVQYAVKGETV